MNSDTASRVEGLKIGADDYVCKPFDAEELLARVDAMLRIKKLHDQVNSARARLERVSLHDELTGLYNYRYLHTRLNEEFKRAEYAPPPLMKRMVALGHLGRKTGRGRPAWSRCCACAY